MTKLLKIYSLDDLEEKVPISILSDGEHTIGREKLNCKDKRVSRNHAVIKVEEGSITLKSTHINPSFYKHKNGNSIQLINRDNSITLDDGDQFALLPNAFWFKVRVIRVPESDSHLKRIHSDEMMTEGHKRSRVEEEENSMANTNDSFDFADLLKKENSISEDSVNANTASVDVFDQFPERTSSIQEDISENHITHSSNDSIPNSKSPYEENVQNSDENLDSTDLSVNQNQNGSMNETEVNEGPNQNAKDESSSHDETIDEEIPEMKDATNNPSTSQVSKRNKCWYGAKCYRKNPSHKTEFSHPGDDDYDTDAGDNQPICPFGDKCYRTNINHRKQYKHLKAPAPKPDIDDVSNNNAGTSDSENAVAGTTSKRAAAKKTKKYEESPEDDYDLEDPFINDGSSDDFQLSDDDEGEDDSDFEDTQEVPEESQETRRLLKEAKKFTKTKEKNFWGI